MILKDIKNEENVCEYYSQYYHEDLLKVKKLTHDVILVAYDAIPNALAIEIIKKFTKNDKSLQLARPKDCYRLSYSTLRTIICSNIFKKLILN